MTMTLALETILVRGVVDAAELQRAWITSPVDPVGPMPTASEVRTVRMLRFMGRVIPGVSPGYMQQKLSTTDVVDEDVCLWWEPVVGSLHSGGGELIRVGADHSGSHTGAARVLKPSEPIPESARGKCSVGDVIGRESGSDEPVVYTRYKDQIGAWSFTYCSGWTFCPAPPAEAEWLEQNGYVR